MTSKNGNAHEWHHDYLESKPPTPAAALLLWTAIVDVGEPADLGSTCKGQRYMVPILGGRFYAGTVDNSIYGAILAGGADRQLQRSDGVKELDAIYEMQLHRGEILSIRNRVIVDQERQPERYACSVIQVTAPDGDYAWLNRRLIVGTLQSLRPEHAAVMIRAWIMEN